MTLPDWTVRMGSLSLTPDNQILIQDITPLGIVSKTADQDRDGASGSWQGTDWAASRTLTIKGTIISGAEPPRFIARYVTGKWNSIGVSGDQVLEIKLPGFPELQCVGRCRNNAGYNAKDWGRSAIPFTLQFDDRRGYLVTTTVWRATGTPSGGTDGAVWPWEWPVSYGSTSSQVMSVWNAGDFATPATVRFSGPSVNPRVTNPATGEYTGISGTIANGDWVEIDPDTATILDSSGASRMTDLSPGSTWLYMPRGSTTLVYTAGGGTTGEVLVSGRTPYAL